LVTVSESSQIEEGYSGSNQAIDYSEVLLIVSDIVRDIAIGSSENFLVNDLVGFVKNLESQFRVVEAAGGFVLNEHGSLLVMKRRGVWDLPKGKIENGESVVQAAKREVEEECGVSNLIIKSEPYTTIHIYQEKGKSIIKKSHWFKMETDFKGDLIPQIEEEIQKVKWMKLPLESKILRNSFGSIRDVIHYFSCV